MPRFRVDIRLDASVYVEAESEDLARDIVLSPNPDELVEHESFFADGVRIDSVHPTDWMHRCLNINSDIVWIAGDDEEDDDE